jgi:hypothetical protein
LISYFVKESETFVNKTLTGDKNVNKIIGASHLTANDFHRDFLVFWQDFSRDERVAFEEKAKAVMFEIQLGG